MWIDARVDDTVIAGLDETLRDFYAAIVTEFPANDLGKRYTACLHVRLGIGDIRN